MADYSIEGNRTGSATLSVLTAQADDSTPRRLQLMEWSFGSEGAVADNPFLWKVERCTDAVTAAGTTVTPAPLDLAEAAALFDAREAITTNPGLGAVLLSVPLNQRATMRWVAQPDVPIIAPATARRGFAVRTTTSASVAITSNVIVREH